MPGHAGDGPPKMPTWVKVFGVLGIVLVLVLLAVLVFGGNQHGPGRHATPAASTSPEGSGNHTRPAEHHGDEVPADSTDWEADEGWTTPVAGPAAPRDPSGSTTGRSAGP